MGLVYITGDATAPQGVGNKIICHICNDEGRWGRGFVVPLGTKYPAAHDSYKAFSAQKKAVLGAVDFATVETSPDLIVVANMIGQRSIYGSKDGSAEGCPPIRYPAVLKCLDQVGAFAASNNASIHAPRFGAGLAGGDWTLIEILLNWMISKHSVSVTIYDLATPAVPPAGDANVLA